MSRGDYGCRFRAGVRHRIAYVPGLLSTYRLHAESKTVAQSRRAAPELERMYQTYFARGDVPAAVRRREREALANMWASERFARTGRWPERVAARLE